MDTPPFVNEDQRQRDNEHINLLSVFHFVLSGLALFGMAFLLLHYFIMCSFFTHPERWPTKGEAGPPKEFFDVFVYFYIFMGVLLVTACVGNVLSGVFLRQRRHRMFSLIVAGLDCVQIPFGTTLGVFTFIVLLRDSVRQSYVE